MGDFCPIKRVDHLEFYVGNAKQAAVFYAAVFLESPAGLKFHAGLSDADTAQVQMAAADTVLGDPSRWGLMRP